MDEPFLEYLYPSRRISKPYVLSVEVGNTQTNRVLRHTFPEATSFCELPYTVRGAVHAMGDARMRSYYRRNELTPDDEITFNFKLENTGFSFYLEVHAYDMYMACTK